MASNYTTNYQLNQWEAGDQVLRTEFNQDNQKIDAALAGLDGRTAALETTVASKGNSQIYTTSYTGTGGVNEAGACCLIFPKPPMLFIIGHPLRYGICVGRGTVVCVGSDTRQTTTWSSDGTTVSWYNYNAAMQLNEEGELYQVVAFLPME